MSIGPLNITLFLFVCENLLIMLTTAVYYDCKVDFLLELRCFAIGLHMYVTNTLPRNNCYQQCFVRQKNGEAGYCF